MFLKPLLYSVGQEFFLQHMVAVGLFRVKGEDVLQAAMGSSAEGRAEHLLQPLVADPLDEILHQLALLVVIEAGDGEVLLRVAVDFVPEGFVLVVGRDKEDFPGEPVEQIDQVVIRVGERFEQVVPHYFHVPHDGHPSLAPQAAISFSIFIFPRFSSIVRVMRHIFIADAHLRAPADTNYRKLLRFLDTLPADTGTLYILGDLFEFWIGHRTVPYPHYLPVLDRFRGLVAQGVEIVYFEGNHDFHMGTFFEQTLRARIYTGPALLDLDGKKVFLCHGDEINGGDYGYRLLRFLFHSTLTRMLARVVPPALPSLIADRMGRSSRKHHAGRREKWDYAALVRAFAARKFEEGCDVVVTGHFHLPLFERDVRGRTLVSLGDWIEHFSYGEWMDGRITLKTFSGE